MRQVRGEWALICATHNVLKLWTALRRRRAAGFGEKPEDGAENPVVVERRQVNLSLAVRIWDESERPCGAQGNVGQALR